MEMNRKPGTERCIRPSTSTARTRHVQADCRDKGHAHGGKDGCTNEEPYVGADIQYIWNDQLETFEKYECPAHDEYPE